MVNAYFQFTDVVTQTLANLFKNIFGIILSGLLSFNLALQGELNARDETTKMALVIQYNH